MLFRSKDRRSPGMRAVCLLVCLCSAVQAFTLGGAGAALQPVAQSASPLGEVAALRVSPGAVSMRCRTNLKKEKRIRNRVNAFRFKKAVPFRFARAGPKKDDSKEATEDAAYYAQVFTQSLAEAPVEGEAEAASS